MVKVITPSQPAPVSQPAAAPGAVQAATRPGIRKSLINWLTGTSGAADKSAPADNTPAPAQPRSQTARPSSDRRDHSHNDRRRRRRNEPRQQASDESGADQPQGRSEEHTSELQSLMRNSYAVFCLKKKTK